jgi:hypothetical protein
MLNVTQAKIKKKLQTQTQQHTSHNNKLLRGVPPGWGFLDYLFKSHWRVPVANTQTKQGLVALFFLIFFYYVLFIYYFIFTIAGSVPPPMRLTAGTCPNSRLLTMWYLKRKAGPIRKVKVYG